MTEIETFPGALSCEFFRFQHFDHFPQCPLMEALPVISSDVTDGRRNVFNIDGVIYNNYRAVTLSFPTSKGSSADQCCQVDLIVHGLQ